MGESGFEDLSTPWIPIEARIGPGVLKLYLRLIRTLRDWLSNLDCPSVDREQLCWKLDSTPFFHDYMPVN